MARTYDYVREFKKKYPATINWWRTKKHSDFLKIFRKRCICDRIAIEKHRSVRNHTCLETQNSKCANPCMNAPWVDYYSFF